MEEESIETDGGLGLAEERLRLEREALAVERERIAAARARAEAEAGLARARRSPALAWAAAIMLGMLCFAGGLISGMAIMEGRQQQLREERLARALSQIGGFAGDSATNSAALPAGMSAHSPGGAHRNVAVMVIQ